MNSRLDPKVIWRGSRPASRSSTDPFAAAVRFEEEPPPARKLVGEERRLVATQAGSRDGLRPQLLRQIEVEPSPLVPKRHRPPTSRPAKGRTASVARERRRPVGTGAIRPLLSERRTSSAPWVSMKTSSFTHRIIRRIRVSAGATGFVSADHRPSGWSGGALRLGLQRVRDLGPSSEKVWAVRFPGALVTRRGSPPEILEPYVPDPVPVRMKLTVFESGRATPALRCWAR